MRGVGARPTSRIDNGLLRYDLPATAHAAEGGASMIRRRSASLLSILVLILPGLAAAKPAAPKVSANKEAAVASVERHRPELVELANQVWTFAETALKEKRSSKVLADYAEAQGFKVERGVAGLPTAFVASYGEGRPVIAILGEYDA